MPQLQPLSSEQHGDLRWQRSPSYAFAEQHSTVPVVVSELPRVLGSLPLAFVHCEHGYRLSAVLGIEAGRNLFVHHGGRWQGAYVPAYLRAHPFYVADARGGRKVIALDGDSELLSTEDPEGDPLFDASGQPSEALQPVLEFLERLARHRAATDRACQSLAEEGLIEPWPAVVADEHGAQRRLEGLYRVPEDGLRAAEVEALGRLRDAGALHVAYAQLLTQQHIQGLTARARARAREAEGRRSASDIDFSQIFGDDDGLRFAWDD